MDVPSVLEMHREWKTKFRISMCKKEHLDIKQIGDASCCSFGQWLATIGKQQFGESATYQDCCEKHEKFHQEASKVADKINHGKYLEADKQFQVGTDYFEASSNLQVAIVTLFKT